MRRFFLLVPVLVGASLIALAACKDQEVVVIKADASASDGGETTTRPDANKVDQPPTGTVTDSGVSGRRLGDRGCKANEDCDSNLCVIGLEEENNYCSLNCTKENAPTVCIEPLAGSCSRTLVCDPPP
ncbi:MAG: hypothetical protein U0270_42170 [Labilithrix sp.]